LFSFGTVMYEMATGQLPFRGDSSATIFEAILNRTPVPPVRLNPELPAEFERIINKCLEKDRDLRCQSASEIRTDLKRLMRDTDSGRIASSTSKTIQEVTSVTKARPVGLRAKQYAVLTACIVLLAVAFLAYHFWPRSKTPHEPPKITQISQWNKPINTARLSPDGHAVAFTSTVGDVSQVFLMLTSGGEPLQLTTDEGDKFVDNFSPDGKEVYYGRTLGQPETWAVPTLGGSPRRVASASYVIPSSDGVHLYYWDFDKLGIFVSDT